MINDKDIHKVSENLSEERETNENPPELATPCSDIQEYSTLEVPDTSENLVDDLEEIIAGQRVIKRSFDVEEISFKPIIDAVLFVQTGFLIDEEDILIIQNGIAGVSLILSWDDYNMAIRLSGHIKNDLTIKQILKHFKDNGHPHLKKVAEPEMFSSVDEKVLGLHVLLS